MVEVFAATRTSAEPGGGDGPTVVSALSAREREVLDLVAAGCTNSDIADRLTISPITARNHVSNILMKLQLTNRTQAAAWARGGR